MSLYNDACIPLINALNPESSTSSGCPGIMASTQKPTFEGEFIVGEVLA